MSIALCKEEGLKLLSLFKGGPPHELAFIVMHCNLKFFFDVSAGKLSYTQIQEAH
jgi:hypothetical protein